jgi:hypothetical protein
MAVYILDGLQGLKGIERTGKGAIKGDLARKWSHIKSEVSKFYLISDQSIQEMVQSAEED